MQQRVVFPTDWKSQNLAQVSKPEMIRKIIKIEATTDHKIITVKITQVRE